VAIGSAALVAVYGVFGLLMTGAIAWVWRRRLLARDAAANSTPHPNPPPGQGEGVKNDPSTMLEAP
jgi:hypothetical protein